MSVILDIIFSTFLGGIITLITINANIVIRQTWASYNSQVMVQQMLVSTAQILEGELRNMGSGLDVTAGSITEASDSCIQFLLALRPEYGTTITTVKYFAGSRDELITSENPNDRYLYRQEGATAPQRVGLISEFRLKYMEQDGTRLTTPVTDPDDLIRIRIIEITMEVQSPFAAYMEEDPVTGLTKRYTSALWKQTRLASQNLYR